MTYRQLLGFTPSMGAFELVAIWAIIPASIKEKLPKELKDVLDALALVVTLYNVAIQTYNAAKIALDKVNQIQVAASLPTNPAVAAGVATEVAAKVALEQALNGVNDMVNSFSNVLDKEVPSA